MLRNLFVFMILSLSLSACKTLNTETVQVKPESQNNSIDANKQTSTSIKTPVEEPIKPAEVKATSVKVEPVVKVKPEPVLLSPKIVITKIEPKPVIQPLPEPEPALVWERLQKGMQLPEKNDRRIDVQRDWYIKHKDYLQRVMKRAEPLLHYILNEIEKKNLPTEYALLPIVESAYQTYAYSHGRASGIWQIIPSTGRYLGLKQDWWYDGRRDLYLSTKAALSYLDSLSKQFNDNPVLALASYNAGPGKIRSAIRFNKKTNRPTDFWHLTKIRKETRDYVPKMYALKQIFSDPEKYGITLLDIIDEPSFEVVTVNQQLDISKAADLAGLELEEFYRLNPAFNHWSTPPKGEHHILLPIGKKAVFETNYAKLDKSDHIKWARHKIKTGETLSQIAVKYNTRINLIKSVNKINGNSIRAGKYLMIPTSTQSLKKYSQSSASRLAKTQNTKRGKHKTFHTVQKGDSFWSIAKKYNVSHKSLAKWNGMAPRDTLSLGKKLVIWRSSAATAIDTVSYSPLSQRKTKIQKLHYTVRKGDSVARIADKFKVRISDIKKWNKIGKYIQPGQKIKLLVDVTTQSI